MKKIKICGITTEKDIEALNKAGVDYAGFVQFFEKSKRNISTDRARELFQGLDPGIEKVAVVVGLDVTQLEQIRKAGFDRIQIHGNVDDEILSQSALPIWKAFNVGETLDLTEFARYEACDRVDGYVFDAHVPGSGRPFDWDILEKLPHTKKFVMLAGGLNPENAKEAAQIPFVNGVDTSSGVENESGDGKSLERILAFVRAVKGAEAANENLSSGR